MAFDMMNREIFLRFREWVDGHAVEGLTSEGKTQKYVPHAAQSEYWTSRKIEEILQSRSTIIASTKEIQDYICILSILTYIEGDDVRGLDYLHEATRRGRDDATLPWIESEQHGIFGDTTVGQLVLQKFIEVQWMFYPMPAQPFLTAQSTMPPRAVISNGQPKFMHDRLIDRRQIFPITKRPDSNHDVRRSGRRVVVSYMDVHVPSQHSEERSTTQVSVTIVFKTYPPEEVQTYDDERNGYTAVRNAREANNILQCLGSFYYKTADGRQYSIIMSELADMTLRDVFLGKELPYQLDHIRAIWASFLGSLYGLATIHNQLATHGYLCIHQDLKPSNIFVFRPRDNRNPFAYQFKIGDFGSSHARSANPVYSDRNGPDRGVTRIYGPPETYLVDTFDSVADSSSDMWAMGCIMIELAVWIIGGKLGLDKFHDQRIEENKGLTELMMLGRSDCFHDGVEVLESVRKVSQIVDENRRVHDTITSEMVNLALEFVLVPKHERLTAQQLIPRVRRHLKLVITNDAVPNGAVTNDSVTLSPGPISPLTPVTPSRTEQTVSPFPGLEVFTLPTRIPSQKQEDASSVNPTLPLLSPTTIPPNTRSTLTKPSNPINTRTSPAGGTSGAAINTTESSVTKKPYPPVTIAELQERIKNGTGNINRELPGFEVVKTLLDRRDFIILIDNSRHTQRYKETVKNSTAALIELLISIDRNGIDVANTSAPHAQKSFKLAEKMSKFVDQTFASGHGGDCMIENALDEMVELIKDRRPGTSSSFRRSLRSFSSSGLRTQKSRGITLLIFTNGLWDQSEDGTSGANRPILNLMKWMQENGISRTQISIQFVRLGAEERGIRRLKILDDELNEEFDIVDTKPITASLWDILIGSMQPGNDNES